MVNGNPFLHGVTPCPDRGAFLEPEQATSQHSFKLLVNGSHKFSNLLFMSALMTPGLACQSSLRLILAQYV